MTSVGKKTLVITVMYKSLILFVSNSYVKNPKMELMHASHGVNFFFT